MNPPQKNPPTQSTGSKPKGLSLNLKSIRPKLKKTWKKNAEHLAFVILILALLVYGFVIWQIKNLSAAEPSPEAESQALGTTKISKIDKKAIAQIQTLEQNSPQVKALFDRARNNPFNE